MRENVHRHRAAGTRPLAPECGIATCAVRGPRLCCLPLKGPTWGDGLTGVGAPTPDLAAWAVTPTEHLQPGAGCLAGLEMSGHHGCLPGATPASTGLSQALQTAVQRAATAHWLTNGPRQGRSPQVLASLGSCQAAVPSARTY